MTFVDLGLDDARLLSLALNQIHGDWDATLLARLLAQLRAVPEIDISLTGFPETEIKALLRRLDGQEKRDRPEYFDLDAAVEAAQSTPARVAPGDCWAFGPHRLLAGDTTDPATVAALLDGATARMAFGDPPYNVGLGDHGGQQPGQRKRRLHNDALPPAEWDAFCRGWATNLLAAVSGSVYVCMGTKEWPTVSRILAEAGGHWSDTLIWRKDRHVLGRADYQRSYEPIWYGWREGVEHHWCGDRDQTDVWEIRRGAANPLHPTQKPTELVERALTNSAEPGDIVLDLFVGSGTTIIAAERTGRTCYALELDLHYCQIVIDRWEAFTGETAVRL